MKNILSRRLFLQRSFAAGIGLTAMKHLSEIPVPSAKGMRFGLVTYLWAQDWDLPTIIRQL